MDRRSFLKILAGIPVLGALALFSSPLFRYLRPTSGPINETKLDMTGAWTEWNGDGGLFSKPDMPTAIKEVSFDISQFPAPWSFQTFTFGQRSREYTFRDFQSTRLPGFVVRLPEDKDGRPDFVVVSRICPHMGCVFNFLEDPHEAGTGYNYPGAKNPLFACPCHLSVFDPLQEQASGGPSGDLPGKVVSGPAPRPPRTFEWELVGDKLLIKAAEAGGIS